MTPSVQSPLAALLVAAACSTAPEYPTPPPDDLAPYSWTTPSSEDIDILETVFRYQFEHNRSVATERNEADYLFVVLGEEDSIDPPAELLARFASHLPPVRPLSAATVSVYGVEHQDDGGQGILLRIERIRRIDANTVDVDGGYFECGTSSSGSTYRVKRRGSGWRVVADADWWIS